MPIFPDADGFPVYPTGYMEGFEVTFNNYATIKIQTGSCRDVDDTEDIDLTSVQTVNITSSGINGLDTGSEAASTWYSIWVIKNPTSGLIKGLFSTSSTTPTMPSGYTKKRRLGWVYNKSDSNFRVFTQLTKTSKDRIVMDGGSFSNVINGVNWTSWTAVSLTSYIPPTSTVVLLRVQGLQTGATSRKIYYIDPLHETYGAVWDYLINTPATANMKEESFCVIGTNSSRQFKAKCESGDGRIYAWVLGYVDVI